MSVWAKASRRERRSVPLHAEAAGELAYALDYADANADMFDIAEP